MARKKRTTSAGRQRVKLFCTVEGYEDAWIEYDVASWGFGMYNRVFAGLNFGSVVSEFVPAHSLDWSIANADGTAISHPGHIEDEEQRAEVWQTVWEQFDVETSRAIFDWMGFSPLLAAQEALRLPPKSAANGKGDGGGAQDATGRDASDTTD